MTRCVLETKEVEERPGEGSKVISNTESLCVQQLEVCVDSEGYQGRFQGNSGKWRGEIREFTIVADPFMTGPRGKGGIFNHS